jgi:hypothetical protein
MKQRFIRYLVALSGSYVQAVRGSNVGEVLNLGSIQSGTFDPMQYWGYEGPKIVKLVNGPGLYIAEIVPGADAFHWLLKVSSTTPGTELAAGAYPASITGDLDVYVEAWGAEYK